MLFSFRLSNTRQNKLDFKLFHHGSASSALDSFRFQLQIGINGTDLLKRKIRPLGYTQRERT